MSNKIIIFAFSIVTFLSITSLVKAAEPLKKHFVLTPAQATAAVDIADAILNEQTHHNQANITKVQSIYNKFFANDLERSAGENIEAQNILEQSLVNAVKTTLMLSDPSLSTLNNDAGRHLFDLIYESKLSAFERFPTLVQSEIVKNLTDRDLARLAQTSKRELAVVKEEMKKRSTFIWKSKKFQQIPLAKHTAFINALTFSHNGNWLVSGSSDKSIIIWDVKNRKIQRQISKHNEAVTAIALSPNGKKIASSSADHTVRVWDFSTGNELKQFPISDSYSPVTFSHNNELLAFLSDMMTVEIRDLERPNNNKTHPFSPVLAQIAFSPNDQILSALKIHGYFALYFWAINNKAHEIKEIDLRVPLAGIDVNQFIENYGPYASAFSLDVNFCAIAWDKDLMLWSTLSKNMLAQLSGHKLAIFATAFSSDSKIVASADLRGEIILWNVETYKAIANFNIGISITALAFSPDNKILAAGGHDGIIKLISAQ